MATAGQDFEEYKRWLEAAGVATSLVKQVEGKFTASFFCSTDKDGNQIASFYTGAMAHAGELSFRAAGPCDIAIVSPNDPGAMVQYAQECRTLGIPYIFDPSQQVARLSAMELEQGVTGAEVLICNDYEFAIIREKTGMDVAAMLRHARAVVVTMGERGSQVLLPDALIEIPAVAPRQIVDPTGVGDAFRGGFLKGLALGAGYEVCGRLGSVAAAFALEHLGGTSHSYTTDEFMERYADAFNGSWEA